MAEEVVKSLKRLRTATEENSQNAENPDISEQSLQKSQARARRRNTMSKDNMSDDDIVIGNKEVSGDEVDQGGEDEYSDSPKRRHTKGKLSNKRTRRSQTAPSSMTQDLESEDECLEESGPRTAGGIVWIDLQSFMNHKKLHVKLNPNLNFITGKNGSGKSAIATALMIVLGSKTGSTGRGNNLGSLVMEGTNSATIRVCLRNTGADAFEPDIYGNKIIIERQIRKSGSGCTSPYCILNSSGQEVSKDRKLLDRILSLFNVRAP